MVPARQAPTLEHTVTILRVHDSIMTPSIPAARVFDALVVPRLQHEGLVFDGLHVAIEPHQTYEHRDEQR